MAKISVIGICGKSVFMPVDHFHAEGETLIAKSMFTEMGGKGINQAIAAARMGATVSFMAAVGDDQTAKECKKVCDDNNVKPFLVEKKGKATPVAFILTDPEGHNRITEYKTAELSACDVLLFEEEIATSDILLLQQEVPKEVNEKAVEIACKNDTKIILNPAPAREISDEIAKKIFLVTPNEQEAEFINSERFENCIITVGDKGCIINVDTNIPAKKVVPKDSTGAGDTFNGVLAVCLAEGMDFITACKYAVHGAGISVSRDYVIDSIPYREETERSLNE